MTHTTPRHLSKQQQARHYFGARRHQQMPSKPLRSAAAWRGVDLRARGAEPFHYLTKTELADIHQGLSAIRGSEKPTIELGAADLPLPSMAYRIADWRRALTNGCGFVLIKGVPVESWDSTTIEQFFWCFGQHLGLPGLQNPAGDLVGHVTDTGASKLDPLVRLYQTNAKIRFHCDGADVVGLLCRHNAKKGGMSRIASSVTVYNELLQHHPELAQRLHEPMKLDRRNEQRADQTPYSEIQPACYDGERLRTFFHADYFRSVTRHVGPLTALELELLNTYEQIAEREDICFEMPFEPGDIQLLSNHTVIHARSAYEDTNRDGDASDLNTAHPNNPPRHLLRLWLSL